MSRRLATAPISESDEDLPRIELTAAEKRKATRASNLAREEEANKALEASTAGKTRLSKAKALSDKVWDPKSTSSQPSNSRKCSLSSTQEPGKTKKAKGRNTTVPEQPAHAPEKTKTLSQSDRTGPTEARNKNAMWGMEKNVGGKKRKWDVGRILGGYVFKRHSEKGRDPSMDPISLHKPHKPPFCAFEGQDIHLEPSKHPLGPAAPPRMLIFIYTYANVFVDRLSTGTDGARDMSGGGVELRGLGECQQPAQGRRRYAAPVILDDSESEDNIIPAAPVKPKPHAKQPKPLSDVDSGDDAGKSEDYDQASDDAVPSGDDGLGDDPAERPRILHPQASPSDDIEMEEVSDHAPSFHHRRQSSSSSRPPSEYEVPNNTDFESGPDMVPDDDSADESDEEAPELLPPKPRKSAQQAKYDLEKPAVKPRAVPPKKTGGDKVKVKLEQQDTAIPTADITDQTKWGVSARIIFPHGRGDLRLNDQHSSLRAVIKLAIELALIDIVFVKAYPGTTSRGTFVRPYLLQAAREFGYGDIKIRVKSDISFCKALADLICARIGLLRNAIKQLAVAKVPVYYQLTDGATPSEIRARVKLILANQQYIFPITWRDRHTPAPVEGSAAPQPSTGKKGTTQEIHKFKVNRPFHASPVVDIMRDMFFANNKALGRKHMELFESTLDDLPDEHELPDSMPALVASHSCGALHNWKTGHFQSTPFAQERLEETYTSLLQVIADMRVPKTAALCHKVMHQLFINTTYVFPPTPIFIYLIQGDRKHGEGVITGGSAGNIIRLDLADDDE
ncbi:hypothetical protein B0H17DRAFT_1127181 [Mycena rosella]|uniref:DUF6532 domain-containing protein n=1 Tax=Mycena rosella TaxID=1033263 RepID=A0AAD7E148_MYCRO|nr:hypothetical protein B0H17DRAFT_1127181 [Mycena rosella]